jgi:hypothetical protein
MKICGRESQLHAAFSAAHDATFDSIRPAQHPPRKIYSTLRQEFANASRTYPASTQTNFRDLVGEKPETLTDGAQQLDVAFTFMTERKSTTEIYFPSVQPIDDDITQEILGAYLGKGLVEVNDDGLFDAEHAERLHFLIEGLQEWRRGLGMQDGAGMRLESNHGRHGANCSRSLDHRLHDQLVTKMQAVEHTERQHGRACDVSVVSSVKEPHQTDQLRRSWALDFIFHLSFFISHLPSEG